MAVEAGIKIDGGAGVTISGNTIENNVASRATEEALEEEEVIRF